MQTNRVETPNHGVTGLSISQDEVDLFLDYLVESEPSASKSAQKRSGDSKY